MTRAVNRLLVWARGVYQALVHEVVRFGTVGLLAFALDTAIYNLLVFGWPGGAAPGPMVDLPLRAKILATSIATVFAWLGNRYWTFRRRRRTRAHHELLLFVVFNAIGLGIALSCLGFSRYVLHLDSQLADNLSGNGVGLVLGTLFRFWAYRTFVFTGEAHAASSGPEARSQLGEATGEAIET